MSSLFTIFPVVAVCLAIGTYLLVANVDSSYSEVLSKTQDAVVIPLVMNEGNCLSSIYDCADKYLAEFDHITSSERVWDALTSKPGYSLDQKVAGTDQKRVEYKLSIDIDSEFSELGLFDYLSVGDGLISLYPRLSINATVTEQVLMSYDWSEGYLDVRQIRGPLYWLLLDRTFTVLNVAHRASRTFVSKTIALSAVEEATFLASALTPRGGYPASLSVSFRVTTLRKAKNARSAAESTAHGGVEKEGMAGENRTGRYRVTVLYSVEGVVARPSLNHFLVRNRFLPNFAAALNGTVS